MSRPIILGVVGDSASGKTTLTRGLVRVLGQEQVSHVCLDDYHRYDRSQRADMGLTPLDPGCNHMDIMGQHLMLLRRGEAIMKPVYRHSDGTFAPPVYLTPGRFLIVEGLLGYHTDTLRDCFDIRVFLDPPESLRRRWKVVRDCSRRGYTTNQVLDELDRRERDSNQYIRPQRHHADMVVRFADPPDAHEIPTPRTWTRTCCCAPAYRTPTCRTSSATTPSRASRWWARTASRTFGCRDGCRRRRRSSSKSGSGSTCTSQTTCDRSAWVSSRSAPTSTAATRLQSCSCSCSTTSSRRGPRSRWVGRRRQRVRNPGGRG